ncbi:MAG: hypothetical protein KDD35_08910, partial [Bdellovibrionales bacterium]|nr:hypothetical protein [Bdellovibrionales bacterium]
NFIKYRQNNLVSPDVFYFVVQQMIEDSRQRQRELGIMALDATASYRSFILLAQFLQVEPHGSGVRSKANHALDRYTQFPQLGILEAVYHSPEASFIRERALILVSNSALINLAHSKNIENSENQTSSQPNSSDENNTQQANKLYIQRYTTILKGLESMLENPRESSQISQTLQSTIENLKNLLNS